MNFVRPRAAFPSGMNGKSSFVLSQELAGKTLATILRMRQPGMSWSQVEKQVVRSVIRVNQVICVDPARRLNEGDVIEFGTGNVTRLNWAERIRILHVDRHLVVVDKPSGLTTERRPEEKKWPVRRKALAPTLDELLPQSLCASRTTTRRTPRTAGKIILVHRLDRDTSGVMVVARTAEAALGLSAQFRRHSAERVYRAVVVGHPGSVTIQSRLVRDRGDGLRGSADAPVGKTAITHVREMERLGGFSIIECWLETGRTNQIRIHLAERNCPVCGDVKYNRRSDGTIIEDGSQAPRLALHAAELGFIHPITQAPLRFLSPWPPELDKLVARLRGD